MQTLIALAFVLTPAAVIYLVHHQRWAQKLGVIVLCYLLGVAVGGAGLIPDAAAGVAQSLSEVMIVLALPLLLFSLDVRRWSSVAGKALLSMIFAVAAVTCLATLLFFIFRDDSAAAADLAAMSVGVYSGGTPNLAAIKAGLEIPNALYLTFHSLDSVVGGLYFLFMLTVGVPLFRAILPRPSAAPDMEGGATDTESEHADQDDYRPLIRLGNVGQVSASVLLGLLVVALSLAVTEIIAILFGGERNSAVLIVALTTLGVLFSLHPRVRALGLSYRLGMYLVYVFCLSVSSMVSIDELASMDATVAIFLLVVVFAGLVLHALLCRMAGVDSDTFMVTSVAAVGSPPFVPLMARALNNPGAILPGMTTGLIGYALGSYIGIGLGLYLRSL